MTPGRRGRSAVHGTIRDAALGHDAVPVDGVPERVLEDVGPVRMVERADVRQPQVEREFDPVCRERLGHRDVLAPLGVDHQAVEVEDAPPPASPPPGCSPCRPTRRRRRPTRRSSARRPRCRRSIPASRAVAAVTGPMAATTGGSASTPAASRKLVTVDDDVNVIDVGHPAPARGRRRRSSRERSGTPRPRRPAQPRARSPSGSTSRATAARASEHLASRRRRAGGKASSSDSATYRSGTRSATRW